jgi:hypothetical protein
MTVESSDAAVTPVPATAGTAADPARTSFDEAVAKVDYRLTFGCEPGPRELRHDTLRGADMPDAYHAGARVSGEWFGGDVLDDDASVESWLEHFARMAVGEAVHEALEWFRVEGRPWLDPHGVHEASIHLLVSELVGRFAQLAGSSEHRCPGGDAALMAMASRFTLDRNAVAPGDRAWRPDLVLHVERERTRRWWIRQIGSGGDVYNVNTGCFDDDWVVRHTSGEARDAYLLALDEALELAHALPAEVLTGLDTTWRWSRHA